MPFCFFLFLFCCRFFELHNFGWGFATMVTSFCRFPNYTIFRYCCYRCNVFDGFYAVFYTVSFLSFLLITQFWGFATLVAMFLRFSVLFSIFFRVTQVWGCASVVAMFLMFSVLSSVTFFCLFVFLLVFFVSVSNYTVLGLCYLVAMC